MDDNVSFSNANIILAFIYCIELPLIILTIISWYELVKIGEEISNKKISIIYGGIKIMDDNVSFSNANIILAFIYCIELPLIILTIISW
ncbi:hypothetical protein KTJ72_06385, partial [Apilactobacillus sp. HBW1]